MGYIKVPKYAKKNAKKGLDNRKNASKSEKFGLSPGEAKTKGISSGVSRARQLIREDKIRESTAKDIKSFLSRFHGMASNNGYTDKILGSIQLWGGNRNKRFLKYLQRKI